MEMKSKHCFTREELVRFVNDNHIKQENIQQIINVENSHYVIFYWAPTEGKILNG